MLCPDRFMQFATSTACLAGHYHSNSGNCIAFADSAADSCGAVMPNAAFAGRDTFVSIQGPPGAFAHRRLEGLIERYRRKPLRCDPDRVLRWLKALRMLNGTTPRPRCIRPNRTCRNSRHDRNQVCKDDCQEQRTRTSRSQLCDHQGKYPTPPCAHGCTANLL